MELYKQKLNFVLWGTFMLLLVLVIFVLNPRSVRSAPSEQIDSQIDTSFTYQGFLEESGSPINGQCDFNFDLYSSETGNVQIGPSSIQALTVQNGIFSAKLDFGMMTSDSGLWLAVSVRCPSGSGSYTTLSPRSQITAAPLANAMPGISVDPESGFIGINNRTLPYAYQLDVNGSIRAKGSIFTTDSTGRILTITSQNLNGGFFQAESNIGSGQAFVRNSSIGSGFIGTEGPNGNRNILLDSLDSNPNHGWLGIQDDLGSTRARILVSSSGEGFVSTQGDNGNDNIRLSSLAGNVDHGWLGLQDSDGNTRSRAYVNSSGEGIISTQGPNGNNNALLSSVSGNPDLGWIGVQNASGSSRARMFVGPTGDGFVTTVGVNGNENVSLTSLGANQNHGYVAVHDSSGTIQAGIFVDTDGSGVVTGDIKNFTMMHPNDPSREIWYASLEGPEVAAYIRGTDALIDGEATIELPEYYSAIIIEESMTAQVTPLSAESLGLAVVEKTLNGVVVKELQNGSGSYEFDFTITAIRTGYEDFEVIRPVSGTRRAHINDSPTGITDGSDIYDEMGSPDGHTEVEDRE